MQTARAIDFAEGFAFHGFRRIRIGAASAGIDRAHLHLHIVLLAISLLTTNLDKTSREELRLPLPLFASLAAVGGIATP